MFNTENYIKNNTTNKFQQVSGSLVKTDPKSFFIRVYDGTDRANRLFSLEPTIYGKSKKYNYETNIPVAVLQIMLAPDNGYICEVVIDE